MVPLYCNFVTSRACNLRCKSCGIWKNPGKVLSTSDSKRVLDKILAIKRPLNVGFTGGEPLLRKDTYELMDHVADKGIRVVINSNGTLPRDAYRKLLDSKVNDIGISLHFLTPEKQDEFCGRAGSWNKIIENIKYLRQNLGKKYMYVQCTLTSYNYDEAIELKDFVNKKLNLPLMLTPATWGPYDAMIKTSNKELSNVGKGYSEVKEYFMKHPESVVRGRTYLKLAFEMFETGKKNWSCMAGDWYYGISPEGNFSICQEMETDLNILDPDFEEKLRSRETREKFRRLRQKCSGCTYACYLESHTMLTHPWEAASKGIQYMGWKKKLSQ